MRTLNNTAVYKALLLAGCAGTFAIAAPAHAQDVDCEVNPTDPACAEADATADAEGGSILVTGSRIRRPDYTANSPTVTVDEDFFDQSSTAAVEESLNRLPQFVVSQSSTASNTGSAGVPLAAGGDIQPNATNTPGAATVSLRGVGANRTLVLIDGRRGTPGNAAGTVDVSTIPSAALQRVEIISGGASATYGADAVAGVTNFILKDNYEGLEIDGQMGIDQHGEGFEYQLGGIIGADFADGRGNVSVAASFNTRELSLQRDNPFYQDLWANPETTTGAYFFTPRPGVSSVTPSAAALAAAFPGADPAIPAPGAPGSPTAFYVNQDGSLFTTGFNARGGSAFYKPWPEFDQGDVHTITKTTSVGTLAFINGFTPQTVPTTRYNFLGRGNYEINDWIGVFGSASFSNSETYTAQEPGPITFGWDVLIPWGDGVYTGRVPAFLNGLLGADAYQNPAVEPSVIRNGDLTPLFPGATIYGAYTDPTPGTLADNPTNPDFTATYGSFLPCANSAVGGCTNTQVFEQVVPDQIEALLNSRTDPNAPVNLAGFLPNPRATYSDVTTYQITGGLEGSVPGMDWTWEAFVSHGQSRTIARQTGMYSLERMRAVFTAPNFGQNFSYTGNQFAGLGGLNPGFGASTGTCTTGLNFFQGYAGISDDCREAIAADNSTRGTTRQTIAEANLQGGLFELPAGQLRFALGASYRENRYELLSESLSTAGRSFLDQIVGIYPSANFENAGIDVREIYGELLVPVLHDLPLVQQFDLELGGRMSDYSTTGTSYTFKILGDWQVNNWLRIRGGFNRAERAPNLAELLLPPQQSFSVDTIGDVCSTRHNNPGSANPETNPDGALDTQAACLALMQRDNNGVYVPPSDTDSFYFPTEAQTRQPTGGGFAFNYAVGNQYFRENIQPAAAALTPETADTWTAGFVIQSPAPSGPLSRLNLTVDYFNITITDPIGRVAPGGVLLRCVSADYNPAVAGIASGATTQDDLDDPAIRAAANAAIQGSTCDAVFRNPTVGSGSNGQFNTNRVISSYFNEGEIQLSGVDANLSWSTDLGPGSLFLNINGNYMIDFKVQVQDGQPFVDYVGTTGTGALGVNGGSSFEYRFFNTLGYTWGPASASIQWQHIPATEDGGEALFLNGQAPEGTDNSGLPAYNLFSLNTSYQLNDVVRIRFGVNNLFNKRPPLTGIDTDIDRSIGQLPQGGYSLFHDVLGRRFYLGASVQF